MKNMGGTEGALLALGVIVLTVATGGAGAAAAPGLAGAGGAGAAGAGAAGAGAAGAAGAGAAGAGAVGAGTVGAGTVAAGTVGAGTVAAGTVGAGTVGAGAVGAGTVGAGAAGAGGAGAAAGSLSAGAMQGAQLAGTLGSVAAGMASADAEAKQAKINAELAGESAKQSMIGAQSRIKAVLSTNLASAGARGLDPSSGSQQVLAERNAEEFVAEAGNISKNKRLRQGMFRQGAKIARRRGQIGAASSVFQGLSAYNQTRF